MKFKLIALALIFSTASSHAVVTSLGTSFDIAFADSANNPIPVGGGYISTGFFSGLADGSIGTSDILTISSAYRPFTSAVGSFGGSGFSGFMSYNSDSQRVSSSSEFFGETLYAVFGNGSTLLDSTEIAVFKSTLIFPDDSSASLDADLSLKFGGVTQSSGSFIVGNTGGTTSPSNGTTTASVPAVNMVQVVPEPSTILLTAFGALALLRRRR